MGPTLKALTAGGMWKRALATLVLSLLLLVNAALLAGTWHSRENDISGTLYGLNTVVIGLLLGTIVMPGLFTEKNPYHALTTPLFFSLVGTSVGIVILFSAVVTFGNDYTINGPLALVTCITAVATYVYHVYQREMSKTWKSAGQ